MFCITKKVKSSCVVVLISISASVYAVQTETLATLSADNIYISDGAPNEVVLQDNVYISLLTTTLRIKTEHAILSEKSIQLPQKSILHWGTEQIIVESMVLPLLNDNFMIEENTVTVERVKEE